MEHVNRLTEAAAPEWPYPPDGHPGVHRVVIEGSPGVEINTHVGGSGVDHNEGGVIATAARSINAIDTVCSAPSGILAAHDLRPLDHLRGMMWRHRDHDCAPSARHRKPGPCRTPREAVIAETVRCILDEGFTPPSVRHITGRAGVTWGVVQYHFGDLDGLLMAVVDKGFGDLAETLADLPAFDEGMSTRTRTELIVDIVWAHSPVRCRWRPWRS